MTPDEELARNQLQMLTPGNIIEVGSKRMIVDARRPSEPGAIPLLGQQGGIYRLSFTDGPMIQFRWYDRRGEAWESKGTFNVTEIDHDLFDEEYRNEKTA